MKKILMVAIVAAISLFFTACGVIGGSFKLTGIPAASNGKYAIVYAAKMDGSVVLVGVQSVNESAKSVTLSRISNGSVSVPMWKVNKSGVMTRYSGNDAVEMVVVGIMNSEKMNSTDPKVILGRMSGAVPFMGSTRFLMGGATKAWSDGKGGGIGDLLKGLKF
jgi:hypothetical protein